MKREMNSIKITVKRGKISKTFTVQSVPNNAQRVGDECTIDGHAWFVTSVKSTTVLASFSGQSGKLKQVFP